MVVTVSQNGSSTLFQIPILPPCQHPKFSLVVIRGVSKTTETLLGRWKQNLSPIFLQMLSKDQLRVHSEIVIFHVNVQETLVRENGH